MMRRGSLDAQQQAEMLRRYESGEPIRTIAAAFGVGRAYPGKLAHRCGLPRRAPKISQALRQRGQARLWKPEPDASPRPAPRRADILGRLMAGEPMLLVAADFDLALDELVAAARATA